jgi:hypothetical protein
LKIVTDEKPTGSLDRPNIPDVCSAMGMNCIGLLDVIRAEKWVIGKGTDSSIDPFSANSPNRLRSSMTVHVTEAEFARDVRAVLAKFEKA